MIAMKQELNCGRMLAFGEFVFQSVFVWSFVVKKIAHIFTSVFPPVQVTAGDTNEETIARSKVSFLYTQTI